MRLGVSAALVDGRVVAGDVEVSPADGTVLATGLPAVDGGGLAVPGLVDLQINGFAGVDLRHADADGYATVAAALAGRGVTAVPADVPLPVARRTTNGASRCSPRCSLRRPRGHGCCRRTSKVPSCHTAGTARTTCRTCVAPDLERCERLLAAGPVGFVTLAPELPGALDTIATFVDAGVVVSIGHSDATSARVDEAVAAGATHLTHCWNAHRRLSARDPGPAGVALSSDGLVVGLIVDLVHVAPEVVVTTWRAATGRIAVTTDAVAAGRDAWRVGPRRRTARRRHHRRWARGTRRLPPEPRVARVRRRRRRARVWGSAAAVARPAGGAPASRRSPPMSWCSTTR